MNDLSKLQSSFMKFWQLNTRRKKSLVEALLVLSAYKVILIFLPFRHFVKNGKKTAITTESEERLEDIIWAITVLGNRMPLGFTCLVQALSVKWLLRNNYNLQLHIGVSKSIDHQFSAHAWITHDDKIILGEQKNQVYEPILNWK